LFRGSFYAHDVGSEIDNIFPALPTIFEGSKEQQQRAKKAKGTEWPCLVFSDSCVRDNEKLSAFVELEREVLTVTFYLESIHPDSCR
jgi:hypothetical protein